MAEDEKQGLGAQARALRDDLAPSKMEEKLEAAVEERPTARHLLDFSIVGKALLIAAVVAAIVWLLIGPRLAAVVLLVLFIGGWILMAQRSADRRRETHDARASDDDADPEPGDSGYEGDRGEIEAEQEQQGEDDEQREAPSRNGSTPDKSRTTG